MCAYGLWRSHTCLLLLLITAQRRVSEGGRVLTWVLGPGWAFQNKINSGSQPCVLDSEFLILLDSIFTKLTFPCA